MPTRSEPVTILSERDSWELLGSVSLGRLVTAVDDEAHVFPVNFAVQNRTILFRTAAGTKLISAAINNQVVFEADDHTAAEGWSVIVRGVARTLRTDDELDEAERAQLLPWTATSKTHYVRVSPVRVTGRRFRFGPEPAGKDPAGLVRHGR
ncbi:pyridoxamine 5'-phosphate oxidase family protein [Mycolicibacterium neworleansense]|uniref:Putative flavin-nucleotide-binding protein n=1 Tax=Mycolicibacterium neworleansense TaxID=146018 RepID=A0A0H5RXU1_9MYCO|nr:putative flavin-nucleotide-binding protein [Mycolicibacterium neworleansense]